MVWKEMGIVCDKETKCNPQEPITKLKSKYKQILPLELHFNNQSMNLKQ